MGVVMVLCQLICNIAIHNIYVAMALVKYGSLITAMQGSIGGHSFSVCNAGAIMFNKPIPRQSQLQNVLDARRAIFAASAAWSALSVAQRDSWATIALATTFYNRLGDPYTPTGYQCYVWINDRLLRASLAPINNGVSCVVQTVNSPPPVSIIYASNTINFGFAMVATTNLRYYVYVLSPRNKSYMGANPQWLLLCNAASYLQADTTILPLIRARYPTKCKVAQYIPIMLINQNSSTGLIQRLGLPALTLIS